LRVTKKGGTIVLLESTTDRRKDPYNISLSRNEWFQIIEDSGGRIQSWHGVDVAILRNLAFRFLGLAEMVGKNVGRRFAEYAMASLLRPVECSVPRILRNASWYSLILVVKK
jgi:hypothetical protein